MPREEGCIFLVLSGERGRLIWSTIQFFPRSLSHSYSLFTPSSSSLAEHAPHRTCLLGSGLSSRSFRDNAHVEPTDTYIDLPNPLESKTFGQLPSPPEGTTIRHFSRAASSLWPPLSSGVLLTTLSPSEGSVVSCQETLEKGIERLHHERLTPNRVAA